MADELSNNQLIDLIRQSPQQAFQYIVDQYHQRLYWHVRRMLIHHEDADDVIQEVMIKVWKHLSSFSGQSAIYTWLYRIATNEALNHIKKQKAQSITKVDQQTHDYLVEQLTADHWFDGDEILTKLQAAIAQLPSTQREVFNLKYFENMKYEDMAEVTGTSVGGLKANYHHAVKKIKAFFDGD